jgi:hypothetical protein
MSEKIELDPWLTGAVQDDGQSELYDENGEGTLAPPCMGDERRIIKVATSRIRAGLDIEGLIRDDHPIQ